jgi:hypothetical protein
VHSFAVEFKFKLDWTGILEVEFFPVKLEFKYNKYRRIPTKSVKFSTSGACRWVLAHSGEIFNDFTIPCSLCMGWWKIEIKTWLEKMLKQQKTSWNDESLVLYHWLNATSSPDWQPRKRLTLSENKRFIILSPATLSSWRGVPKFSEAGPVEGRITSPRARLSLVRSSEPVAY